MQSSLVCPQCTAPILREAIDVTLGLATCPHCAHTFELPRPSVAVLKHKTRAIPDRVRVFQSDNGLLMIVNKRHPTELWHYSLFTLIWNLVIGFVMAVVLTSEPVLGGWVGCFLGIFLLVGLWLIYYCVALVINKTNILVDEHGLAITTEPLPPHHRWVIDHSQIHDLYYTQRTADTMKVNGQSIRPYDYEVYAWLTDDTHQRIFTADDESIALYVGQRLKAALGLSGEFEQRTGRGDAYLAFTQLEKRKRRE